nr:hypothetical protein BaRGS_005022 [Batillaria attramentaria]
MSKSGFQSVEINKKNVCDDPSLQQVPFPLLAGENAEFLGRSEDGVVTITNFRILICMRKSFVNVPLRLVETVEIRDLVCLVLTCKDATTVRCLFKNNDDCLKWHKRVLSRTGPPQDLNGIFAFAFFSHGSELQLPQAASQPSSSACDESAQLCVPLDDQYAYSFGKDVQRMKFDTKKAWRILLTNEDYSLCPSYPQHHIVPACVTDENINSVASFRSGRRFPSVVWRDQQTGAVIVRCSQPELGWLGWRNQDDEALIRSIPEACALDPGKLNSQSSQEDLGLDDEDGLQTQVKIATAKKMLLVDCRSYSAAIANRAKGGGCESADYYTNCEIHFMNLANIHTIRKSFHALRNLCSSYPDQANWFSNLDGTKWLQHIGAIIRATMTVVSAVKDSRCVLIHCSDGWDRTPQVCALAQLLLDPYYRTIQGFQWLVEREWLEFGHKFADRCGHATGSDDLNERAPVFLQWLDCVYQVTRQFPLAFEFNEAFLVKLVHHTYACLFGTFLFNTAQKRRNESMSNPTASVWSLLHPESTKFHNPVYSPTQDSQVLYPDDSVHRLSLWTSIYLSKNSPKTSGAEFVTNLEDNIEQVLTPDGGLQKTRSCENLTTVCASQEPSPNLARRLSDPNITCGVQDPLALLSKEVDSSQAKNSEDVTSDESTEYESVDTVGEVGSCVSEGGGSGVGESEGSTSPFPEEEAGEEGAASEQVASESRERVGEEGAEEGQVPSVCQSDKGNCGEGTEHSSHALNAEASGGSSKNTSSSSQASAQGGMENSLNGGASPGTSSSNLANGHLENGVETSLAVINGHADVGAELDSAVVNGLASGDDGVPQNGLTNGVHLGEENEVLQGSGGEHKLPIDGSTDTLTGNDDEVVDQALLLKARRRYNSDMGPQQARIYQNGCLLHMENGTSGNESDPEGEDGDRRRDLDPASVHSLKLMIQKNASISTSTTDISDSHVCASHCGGVGAAEMFACASSVCLHNRIGCSNAMCGMGGMGRPTPSSSEASPSVCSLAATPVNSHTPPSTCSPTPQGMEGKVSESPLCRQLNSVGRHLDSDGLTAFDDPLLTRVQQIEDGYKQRIAELEAQLTDAQQRLHQLLPSCNGAGRAMVEPAECLNCPQECSDGGEFSSLGAESNPASDVSWEQVDEKDSKITLWVPDHVVTHCAACGGNFWIGRRKHHCRNCGKVYCAPCSNYFAPVPAQHLQEPVRLCGGCFNTLHQPGPAAASDDSRIAVAAE